MLFALITGGLDQYGRVIMYAKVSRVGPQAMPNHVYLRYAR